MAKAKIEKVKARWLGRADQIASDPLFVSHSNGKTTVFLFEGNGEWCADVNLQDEHIKDAAVYSLKEAKATGKKILILSDNVETLDPESVYVSIDMQSLINRIQSSYDYDFVEAMREQAAKRGDHQVEVVIERKLASMKKPKKKVVAQEAPTEAPTEAEQAPQVETQQDL